ncbi:MAG: HD domain-containing protein [Desulfobacterales bacterium]
MDPFELISEYYRPGTRLYDILVKHSELVAQKALKIAENVAHLKPDLDFIEEASMLHDIGIFQTDVRQLGCRGSHPYVVHGYLGRIILEQKGFPRHALTCERHVGAGITAEDILERNIPLPVRDMVPESIEEKIICFADKFFSKDPDGVKNEKTIEEVLAKLKNYGPGQVERFLKWVELFEGDSRSL